MVGLNQVQSPQTIGPGYPLLWEGMVTVSGASALAPGTKHPPPQGASLLYEGANAPVGGPSVHK